MPATSEDVHGRDRPGYDELLKAGPISRHRRGAACIGMAGTSPAMTC